MSQRVWQWRSTAGQSKQHRVPPSTFTSADTVDGFLIFPFFNKFQLQPFYIKRILLLYLTTHSNSSMSFNPLAPFMACLGLDRKPRVEFNVETSIEPKYSDNEHIDDEIAMAASRFVSMLLTAKTADPSDVHLQAGLKDTVSTCGYYDRLAKMILEKLTNTLKNGAAFGNTMKEASERAAEAAVGFVKEHPAYCTIIALGILVIVAPWVLEILGFAELGPVEGLSIQSSNRVSE